MIRHTAFSDRWPIVELREVVQFLDHMRVPVKASERVPGPYPYYGANGQQGTINGFIFDEPLTLLAEDGGHFGHPEKTIAYAVDGKCWVNNHAHVLRHKKNLDVRFLTRVLENYDVTPFITGSTRGKLTKNAASRIPIPLPPLPEQRRIAALLDKADVLRRLRRRGIRRLDDLLQSVFLEMFGDPVTNPKGWESKSLEALIKGIRYGTGSPPGYSEEGFPFIRATNIKKGTVSDNDLKYISEEKAKTIAKCKISTGDLLIVRSGVNSGDCAIIPKEYDGAYAGYDLIVEAHFNLAVYINHYINSPEGQQVIKPLTRRAGQPHLNADQVKGLKLISPPNEVLEKFSSVVKYLNSLHKTVEDEFNLIENLFSALQQKAFRNELSGNSK